LRKRGVNVHRLCEGLGIRILPLREAKEPRPSNVIYGAGYLRSLASKYGPDHCHKVLRCIQVSNDKALYSDCLIAVSRYVRAKAKGQGISELVDRFGQVDIGKLRTHSLAICEGITKRRVDTLSVLLADRMVNELDT